MDDWSAPWAVIDTAQALADWDRKRQHLREPPAHIGKRRTVSVESLVNRRTQDELRRLRADLERGAALLALYKSMDWMQTEYPGLAARAWRLC